MAALTGRVFLVAPENNIHAYLDFNWDVDYAKYARMYANASRCNLDANRLTRPDLDFCGGSAGITVMQYARSDDYDLPLLEVNPALQATLQRMFPQGNIFHIVATRLFGFSQTVQQAASQYSQLSDECLVGVHIRRRKRFAGVPDIPLTNLTEQFAGIVRSMAGHAPGSVFVAADTDVFGLMSQQLPWRTVWWTNETQASLRTTNSAGNPGSDLSAFVDLLLLSRCQQLLVTAGSSFGLVAAGYSDTIPVNAVIGPHEAPFFNPYFWKGVSSEPQMYKAGRKEQGRLSEANVRLLLTKHIHALQLQQLHP